MWYLSKTLVAEAAVLSLPLLKNNFSKTSLIPIESYVRQTQVFFSYLNFCPPAADPSIPEVATEPRTPDTIAFFAT